MQGGLRGDTGDEHQAGDRPRCCSFQYTFRGIKRVPLLFEIFLPMLLFSAEQTDLIIREAFLFQQSNGAAGIDEIRINCDGFVTGASHRRLCFAG
jgi:hypothetical protein